MKTGSSLFVGAWTALATPFTKDGTALDLESLHRLVEFQITHGIDGLVACGSTGEAATLTSDEYFSVIDEVLKVVAGRAPVVAGIGTSNTAIAVDLAKKLSSRKLSGLMVAAPAYNKPTQQGLIAHFTAVKQATSLPLIAYNVPGRAAVNILPATFATLAKDQIIVAIKEACGSMDQILDLCALLTNTPVTLLSGDDSLTLPVMACGGHGVISVLSNVRPAEVKKVTALCAAGDFEAARVLSLQLLPLTRALFSESNPIPVKAALEIQGVIKSSSVRLPLLAAQNSTRTQLTELLNHE